MAIPVRGSAFDHPAQRRGSPNLHLACSTRWTDMLEERGAFYLGDTARRGTARSSLWRRNRVLAIDALGHPSVYTNACPHAGKRLVNPAMGLRFHEGETLRCAWHNSVIRTADGRLQRCGAMSVPVSAVPEPQCTPAEIHIWNGLVFELGRDAETARRNLQHALDFVDTTAGTTFDFRNYMLQRTTVSPQQADMLTTLVNYVDIRHLGNHADTLGQLVDLRAYTHQSNDVAIVQRMGMHPEWLDGESEWVKKYHKSGLPTTLSHGAVWVITNTGLMLEWYPGVIVVSQCLPDPNDPWHSILYHDFYYHQRASDEFIRSHQLVFQQTGDEDNAWCSESSEHLQDLIRSGRGDEVWGFLDPEQENYAGWLYDHAERAFCPL